MRLINVDERDCWACKHHALGKCDAEWCDHGESFEIREDVQNAKTIREVDFVQHGKWLINSDGYYPYCSVCKKEPISGKMSKYCPDCGAAMDVK